MTVRLGDRDLKVLLKCAKAQWLSTSQLARLYFSGVTPDAVRRSLRRLTAAGYLTAWRENRMSEALHAVGPKGKSILEAKGISVELHRTPPRQLAHLVGINDIRVAVETSGLEIAFFYAAWELGDFGWVYDAIPDAVFAVKLTERRTFIVEYDRGTETVEIVFRKVARYNEGLRGFPVTAVLLVTETPRRLQDLAAYAKDEALRIPVLKSSLEDFRSLGIDAPVFTDVIGTRSAKFSIKNIGFDLS
jgi:hypothetical protein